VEKESKGPASSVRRSSMVKLLLYREKEYIYSLIPCQLTKAKKKMGKFPQRGGGKGA